MHYYKLVVTYDGTLYDGWQSQPSGNAIADVMSKSFYATFLRPVSIIGASRTDAGVHALGQVVRCALNFSLETSSLFYAWNKALPSNIVIRSLEKVDASFHPQKNVQQKIYWYHFFLHRPLPFITRYGYYFDHPINIQKLSQALALFVGEHDFRSFCTGTNQRTVRRIDNFSVCYLSRYKVYRIQVKGPAFARHMIRRLVGACLEIASRDFLSLEYLKDIFDQKDPENTLPTAPAKGLLLRKIVYGN